MDTAPVTMSARLAGDVQASRNVRDIKFIRIIISGPYMTTITGTVPFDSAAETVQKTISVPVRTDRKFHMDALDADGKAIYVGETMQDVAKGAPPGASSTAVAR